LSPEKQEPQPPEISYDRLIKTCLSRHYADVVTWLLNDRPLEVNSLDPNLSTTVERRADKILEACFRGRPNLLIHLEFQIQGSRDIPKRMIQYAALLLDLLDLPEHRGKQFLNIVVYLDKSTYRKDPGYFHLEFSPGNLLSYQYTVLKLWELDPEPVLGLKIPGIWPFVPLMRGDPIELLLKSRGKILDLPDKMASLDSKQQLLTILAGLSWRIVKDRRLLQSLFTELPNMSMNEFLDFLFEGKRTQVLQEGRKEEARANLLRILRRRFGSAADPLGSHIEAIQDIEELEMLVEEAAVQPDLKSFLTLLPPNQE